ncbi:MAG: TIM barrel protein [Planctomycetota bacterium]
MFLVGLNPYGIAFSVGLFGADSPRANPRPLGLNGFLDLAESVGAAGVEIPVALLKDVSDAEVNRVCARLHEKGKYAILMHGISWPDLNGSLAVAERFGFPIIRLHMTGILCGDRSKLGAEWPRLIADARAQLKTFAHKAADLGIDVTIEDHQDLTSAELVEICGEAGPNVGICFDTGNPLSVGEEPVHFARTVAPLVRHLHLKDYRVYWTADGYRLARCPIGEGVVPFQKIAKVLEPFGPLPASIEPGALSERHISLLNESWWEHYPARKTSDFAACIKFARAEAEPDDAEWRTPWELERDARAVALYEIDELAHSVANLKELGIMPA